MLKLFIAISFYCVAVFGNTATLMVQVNFSGNDHEVVDAWLVEQDLPANFRLKGRNDDIRFDLLDVNKDLISSSYTNQPAPIYGAHILATTEEKQQLGKQKSLVVRGSYYLRIPHYKKAMNTILLSPSLKVKSQIASKKITQSESQRLKNKGYSLTKLQFK